MKQVNSVNAQDVQVVISLGRADFGRCPIGSKRPAALWPVGGMSALEHLLSKLVQEGVEQVTICAGREYAETLKSMDLDRQLSIDYIFEELPLGTAGCLRAVSEKCASDLFIVMPANTVFPPLIQELREVYENDPAHLTVFYNPVESKSKMPAECSDIFICERAVLELVPDAGFCDIKEGLVPLLLREGLRARQAGLQQDVGRFRDRMSYLRVVERYLDSLKKKKFTGYTWVGCAGSEDSRALIADSAEIHESASLYGPVLVMEGANIGRDSLILGPATIESNVRINEDCVLSHSAVWQGASLARGCNVQRCVVEDHSQIYDFGSVQDACISVPQQKTQARFRAVSHIWAAMRKISDVTIFRVCAAVVVLAAFIWSYGRGLADLWKIWSGSDEYSSGLLVPILALYVLYVRKADLAKCRLKSCLGWGLLALLFAQGVRFVGLFLMYGSAERLSIVLSVYALVIMLCGLQLFRKMTAVLLFLLLMLPLPNSVQSRITTPLQEWATASAVACLETLRDDVVSEGNIIVVGDTRVAVAEACNGLRMITAFFVITSLVVLLAKRSKLEKGIILAASLPIALVCNTVRLTVTSLIFTQVQGEHWEKAFHDFGGYAMMPLALGMIILILWITTRLTTPPTPADVVVSKGDKPNTSSNKGRSDE